jgi:lipid-A-disaccharide synthase-like uncharacterized protein
MAWAAMAPPASTSGFLEPYLKPIFGSWLYTESFWWTVVGFAGGGLFSARFLLQWLMTEKHKRLTVPPVFWYCSFWGSLINTIYFIHLDKAPPILMNIFLPFLYMRNLIYLGRAQQKTLQG